MKTVFERFLESAEKYPDREALKCGDKILNYNELVQEIAGIQALILSNGGLKNRRVGILTGNYTETYSAILAILGLAAAYVPINRKNPIDRNKAVLEDAEVDMLLAVSPNEEIIELCKELGKPVSVFNISKIENRNVTIINTGVSETDLAYLLFTSGSTGKPKGVPIYHKNINAFFQAILDSGLYDFNETDRFLQMFELTFDLSVFSFLAPLCIGGCCCTVSDEGLTYLNVMDVLEDEEVTVALMVPSILGYLQGYFNEISLPNLRWNLFCGEALPTKLVRNWQQCVPNAKIENVYGPTEATIFCLRYPVDKEGDIEELNGVVAIGKPLPKVEIGLLDSENELILAGEQVTDGYWRNPEKTAISFIQHFDNSSVVYKTGDSCLINENGNYLYVGRIDNQVKIDGFRVELGEIEHHTREFTQSGQVAAIAKNINENTQIYLYIGGYQGSEKKINEFLQSKLPPYMIPRKIYFLDSLPLNLNGKIDRVKLKELI